MKDFVVGAIQGYTWPQISSWVNSLLRCGFDGDKAFICYGYSADDPLIQKVVDLGFTCHLLPNPSYIVHMQRWEDLSILLQQTCENHGYVIHTDVKDVVFQGNPSEWLRNNLRSSGKMICVASEGVKYKDEEWNKNNMLESFGSREYEKIKDSVVLNSGTIAAELPAMEEIAYRIFKLCKGSKSRVPDQAALNVIFYNDVIGEGIFNCNLLTATSDSGYVAQLGTIANPSLYPVLVESVPEIRDDKVYTKDGRLFSIIHQYDRVPGLRERVWAKYWSLE